MPEHLLHGLVIDSPVRLAAPQAPAGASVDVRVDVVRTDALEAPVGEVVVHAEVDLADSSYRLLSTDDAWIVHFVGTGLARLPIDPVAGSTVALTLRRDRVPDPAPLVAGPVAVAAAVASGHGLVHASAVVLDVGAPTAVALFGPAGRGKSSLAALVCERGAHLLSDDTVRIDIDARTSTAPRVWPGTTSTRLRAGSPLVEDDDDHAGDGRRLRDAVAPWADPVPLGALVEPVLHPEATAPGLVPLRGMAALLALQAAVPLPALRGPLLARHFDLAALLAGHVPVYRMVLPWRPGGDTAALGDAAATLLTSAIARSAAGADPVVMP